MSYIPGSHKVGYAIRKGIYEGKIKYKPYWNLRDSRDLVLKNKEYFKNFFQDQFFIVQNFLDKSEFINTTPEDAFYMHGINLEDLGLIENDMQASSLLTYQIVDFS